MTFEILLKLLAEIAPPALATAATAFGVREFFTLRKKENRSSEDIAAIAETVRSEREGRSVAVAEVLAAQAIGENPTPERFREMLQAVMTQSAAGRTQSPSPSNI